MEAQIIFFPAPNRTRKITADDIDQLVEAELQLSLTKLAPKQSIAAPSKIPHADILGNAAPEFLFPNKMMPEGVQFANADEINNQRKELDKELAQISDVLGEFQTRRIAKMIQAMSMSIADNAYAEGLSTGFLYLDGQ